LLAFDSSAGVISESKNCIVVESDGGDLGGGTWKGQLLDDCDSADGASGGGIIAALNQQHYLIGIRNGSHWNEQVYPTDRFPLGPPDGSTWDRRSNTNFGRAIDTHLLEEINLLIGSIED
jgi:energy-converting hydrogenase Eha subunit B